MKIGHPADKPPAAGAVGTAATASTGAAEAGQAAHGTPAKGVENVDASATVALSSTAATLLSPGTGADFDAEKVARIGAAIAGGSFKVNADAIADKLIANARELLTRTSA